MLTNQRDLAVAIRLFAKAISERPRRLNMLLERNNILAIAAENLSAAQNEDKTLDALKTINRVLSAFGKAPRTGTLAEDTDSLNQILLAGIKITAEVAEAQKSEIGPEFEKELRDLKHQMLTITEFLKKRRRFIYDLQNSRIGGH